MHKTVLITGGAGYIGSHTAFLMAQKGYRVIIIDALMHHQSFNHPWAQLIKQDFADKATLKQIFKHYTIDAVMHFAACIQVGQSVIDPGEYYDNNVVKTLSLLEMMRTHAVKKIIFSSSAAVYGNPHTTPITESHPTEPINPYGKTKLMVEQILRDYDSAYGIKSVSLRYFNAAGALPEHSLFEQHVPETHLIPLLLHAAQTGKPFTIFGTDHATPDGTCIRDYVHVYDIANAHACALEHLDKGMPTDVFNLGTAQGVSVKEMIAQTENMLGTSLKIVPHKRRQGDPPMLVADPSKAQGILQWQAYHSTLETIIKSAWLGYDLQTRQQRAKIIKELNN